MNPFHISILGARLNTVYLPIELIKMGGGGGGGTKNKSLELFFISQNKQ